MSNPSKHAARTAQDYAARVEAIRLLIDKGELVPEADVYALAREGLAGSDVLHTKAVLRACHFAAHITERVNLGQAISLLNSAKAVAEKRGLISSSLAFELHVAEMGFRMGHHAESFRRLVDLAGSAQLVSMKPLHRGRLFVLLAINALVADPDDSVTLAMRLAEHAWQRQTKPVPIVYRVWHNVPTIFQLLYAEPALGTRLRRVDWSEDRRQAVLGRIEASLATCRLEAKTCGLDMVTGSWTAQNATVQTLRTRRADPVLQAWESLGPASATQPTWLDVNRLWILYSLLAVGHVELADRLGQQIAGSEPSAHWALELDWLHLRSAVARAAGRVDESLLHYEAYVQQAMKFMPAINFNVRALLQTLTKLPGGRPGDAPDERPAYLQRALNLVSTANLPPSVADLASAAGVSERTLRDAFATHMGHSPKEYLLRERLRKVHAALNSGQTQRSISELAAEHGFSHPSRFAAKYRELFGRSPSSRSNRG
jgi:AraC-like DNA-binding protein